jgi:WD40 repeat protein
MLTGAAGSITDARMRPDGELIVVVGKDGEARLWNPTTGQVLDLRGHTATLRVARFSRGSQWVVTGGDDRTARVWNSVSGELRAVLQGLAGQCAQ